MIFFDSSSIKFAVLSETDVDFEPALLPRNGSSPSSSYLIGTSFSDKPHLVTIFLASSVARSISLDAPVVTPPSP